MVCEVVIGREQSTDAGWTFDVVVRCDGVERDHHARMSWVDYDYWCGGSVAPAEVARAAIETALRAGAADNLAPTFDLSTLRRRTAGFDETVRACFGRGAPHGADGRGADSQARTTG